MRAVIVEAFGGPESLVAADVPEPAPGTAQVLIEVEASDVLFVEAMMRGGFADGPMRPRLPWIPGNGVVGRVAAVGAEVDPALTGTLVGVHTGGRGGYAERVVADAAEAVPVPEGVTATTAAALLHDGMTALALVDDVTRVRAGETVLVLGASGGLGIAVVQLARARGARVVAIARDRHKLERIASEVRPDATVDSDDAAWPDRARVALGSGGADIVFDNVGAPLGVPALALLAEGGRFSAHGTPSGAFTELDPAEVRVRGATVTDITAVQPGPDEMAALTARAFAAAASGELAPIVGQTFPVAEAVRAHAAIEARTVFGKTLLVRG